MKWPATRIADSTPAGFGMYQKARLPKYQGIDLIHLEVGKPNCDTPLHIKEASKKALDDGIVHYGEFAGETVLREAIVARLRRDKKLDVTADQIIVTNGLTHASFAVFFAAVDPGDEVIVLAPYYPQHIGKIELAGGVPVFVPLDRDNGYSIDAAAIEAAITPRTRMICLVNPSNPTGRVYTRAELDAVADLAIRHDLLVLSDEVYEEIVFDDVEHISIASLPGMAERTFSLFAFTKSYAMDGWRLGYIAADPRFIPALLQITIADVAHVNVFAQHGALAALTGDPAPRAAIHAEDTRRRDLTVAGLNALPGVECRPPEGAVYAFADIRGTGKTSQVFADEMLDNAHVVVESGDFYGPAGEGHIRICFGSEPYERIEEALRRMARYLGE
ncbi:aspartate aminotransferase [Luminiphilus syltensis NOR5-1B]|uniref:Aspartate aminotransferase n=1 Tax=Luminiphilus syltensis NOR5-1B TaxID=565045 RepID=B8KTX6_9GAMM|nr:pyridoxal phosphate-dependent aminotransferase [Luminiphilus syltensis]EED35559.1 aspartate aminotransferase [Luminiphilus syltensis NOR5-1B]